MKFSYTAIWEDAAAMARANGSLIAALTGVFIFLPALLLAYLLPQPETTDPKLFWPNLIEYAVTNWHWLLIEGLVNTLGTLAILLLVLRARSTSVGEAITGGLALLPLYFLAALISGVAVMAGFMLFIIPGLYLFARFVPLAPIFAAENERSPMRALARAWQLTKGSSWRILGFVLLLAIPAMLLMTVINLIFGIVFRLAASEELGRLLETIVASASAAAFSALMVLVYAAIYRRLTAHASPAAAGGTGATTGI